ncbi:MAG TPA: phosphopantetheine-binding protein, partial [Ruminiclostridium sp.]|nr:phosphopantetheine-binding protein [Ruminiclostridium sp.]
GYMNQPGLTRERFIDDPFKGTGYLFKTGDMGRYLEDGTIALSGRSDHQIKIRGMRIELGEIERVLGEHPDVREAVVKDWEGRTGKWLAAYVVLENDGPDTVKLKEYMKDKLPEYMIPSVITVLESMPLLPSGKIDRRSLPRPGTDQLVGEHDYIEPETEIEIEIVQIWEELLGVKRISVVESFFNVGGHSLLATQLISRIRMKFAVEISLKKFFASPTVRSLAEEVEMELLSGISEEEFNQLIQSISEE